MQVCIKQDPRGPHRSPGKHFQSINTFAQSYDNTIMLIKKEKKDIQSTSGKDALCQV